MIGRVLDFMERGPTGNPFLDLCIIKGRFPSRKAQFCTQFLKTEPATGTRWVDGRRVHADQLAGHPRRRITEPRCAAGIRGSRGYSIYRPIHQWTVAQVFDIHRRHNIKPNPLYLQGHGPRWLYAVHQCGQDEILEISKRFPEHIDRIEEWERIVVLVSKRSNATFFSAPGDNIGAWDRGNIRAIVQWSKTQHGGRKLDMFRALGRVANVRLCVWVVRMTNTTPFASPVPTRNQSQRVAV